MLPDLVIQETLVGPIASDSGRLRQKHYVERWGVTRQWRNRDSHAVAKAIARRRGRCEMGVIARYLMRAEALGFGCGDIGVPGDDTWKSRILTIGFGMMAQVR